MNHSMNNPRTFIFAINWKGYFSATSVWEQYTINFKCYHSICLCTRDHQMAE